MSGAVPTWTLERGEAGYPTRLHTCLGRDAPERLSFCGQRHLFERHARWLGLFASVRCPGSVILRTYDLSIALRQAGVPVIGGFHSPMEQEALRLLLRGQQPVILSPARGLQGMRLKQEHRQPVAEGRLLIMSAFVDGVRRSTSQSAAYRNRIVAALADALLVAHAQPGGKTEALVRQALGWGKTVYTLDSPANEHLTTLGARAFDLEEWVRGR